MKLDRITSWLKKNKAAALGVAGAGVAGLALVMRSRSDASTSPAKTSTLAVGDTTATDLYNSLQPQLEGIYDRIAANNAGAGYYPWWPVAPTPTQPNPPSSSAPPAPNPTPAAPATVTAASTSSPVPNSRIATPAGATITPASPLASVVGAGFVNSYEGTTAGWIPATNPTGSIQAPPGGVLEGGVWRSGVLRSGTYVMPDGSRTTVRAPR